jgi:hypothetical protein
MIDVPAAGDLAPAAVEMFGDLDASAEVTFGSAYEHVERADLNMIRSYLEPRIGTLERAREFERMLVSLDAGDLHAVTPLLGPAHPAHPLVWGTDDVLFDVSWAYWLRDTIRALPAWSPSTVPGCSFLKNASWISCTWNSTRRRSPPARA